MKPEIRNIEIRLTDDTERRGPGILRGVLLTYEERASDRPERFEQGALEWPTDGVVLREMHDRRQPLTRFVPETDGKRVLLKAVLPDTQRARDAAALVRNKTYRGLSVEFFPETETYQGELRIIRKARLVGAGLVDNPAYSGSQVNIRNKAETPPLKAWLYV